jgi:predicted acylesterase/phospholipase RssA
MKRLVFAGGGARCISFIHALAALDPILIKDVTEWWGTSAGALIAALLSVQFELSTLVHLSNTFDFRHFRNMELHTLFDMVHTWGVDPGEGLLEGIFGILDLVGAKDWTLSKVPGLHIIIADITNSTTLICSAKTHPDLLIAHALRASMSIPFIYMPYRHTNGHLWVDGGVRHNFAWSLLTPAEQEESIGFFFGTSQSGSTGQNPKDFSQYLLRLVHFSENGILKGHLLPVHIPNFPAWYLNLKEEDRLELATVGRAAGHLFMKEWLAKSSCTRSDPVKTQLPSPSPTSPAHPAVETSDTLRYSSPSLPPGLHRNPPWKSSPLTRRWSV